jgi:hypothetical protein
MKPERHQHKTWDVACSVANENIEVGGQSWHRDETREIINWRIKMRRMTKPTILIAFMPKEIENNECSEKDVRFKRAVIALKTRKSRPVIVHIHLNQEEIKEFSKLHTYRVQSTAFQLKNSASIKTRMYGILELSNPFFLSENIPSSKEDLTHDTPCIDKARFAGPNS